jgi:hypothetical protein
MLTHVPAGRLPPAGVADRRLLGEHAVMVKAASRLEDNADQTRLNRRGFDITAGLLTRSSRNVVIWPERLTRVFTSPAKGRNTIGAARIHNESRAGNRSLLPAAFVSVPLSVVVPRH